MIMSEKSGIDIGSLLRSVGSDSVIVYITSSDDFALAAYGVHAARYLIKPVSEESFFEAMDAAWAHTKVRKRLLFRVRTKEGTVSVPYSGIEYIENYSRTLNVCLADGGASGVYSSGNPLTRRSGRSPRTEASCRSTNPF